MRGLLGALVAVGLSAPSFALAERVLLLPLEHPGLDPDVVEALERGLRTEARGVLEDPKSARGGAEHVLLPRPALGLDALSLAAGCAALDRACLASLAKSQNARVLRLRIERGEGLSTARAGASSSARGRAGASSTARGRAEASSTARGRAEASSTARGRAGASSTARGRAGASSTARGRAGAFDVFEVVISDPDGVVPHRSEVHPVDADSGAELRYHLARALGAERAPPRARIAPSAPLPPDVEVWLDDRLVPREALEDVDPGPHRVELRGAAWDTFVWTGRARPGRTVSLPVGGLERKAERAAPDDSTRLEAERSAPVHTWWLGAAGALTLGVAVPILGAEVEAQEAAVIERGIDCAASPALAACQEGFDRATRTNLALGVGLGLVAAAGVVFFLEDGPGWLEGLTAGPVLGAERAGWALGGRF